MQSFKITLKWLDTSRGTIYFIEDQSLRQPVIEHYTTYIEDTKSWDSSRACDRLMIKDWSRQSCGSLVKGIICILLSLEARAQLEQDVVSN